jgi:4-hydroxybenzoate polyprenyltransferase
MNLKEITKYIISVSRFRFWLYTAGTYVVGYSMATMNFLNFFRLEYIFFLFYFFIPANIFIYGVNDHFDTKTDELNPKKGSKEEKLTKEKDKVLKKLILISLFLSAFVLFLGDTTAATLMIIFLLLSYFYSAPPIRFKSIPFLDFSSNMLYIMPGIFGFYIAGGVLPPLILILAGYFHVAAMHLFSAIPDIEYDKKAGVKTTATLIGYYPSLILCTIFWIALSLITITLANLHPLSFLIFIYPLVTISLLVFKKLNINKIYWYFPYINSILGGFLTLMLLLNIFGFNVYF